MKILNITLTLLVLAFISCDKDDKTPENTILAKEFHLSPDKNNTYKKQIFYDIDDDKNLEYAKGDGKYEENISLLNGDYNSARDSAGAPKRTFTYKYPQGKALESWDLLFTQYYAETFNKKGEVFYYFVVGVLTNKNNKVTSYRVEDDKFESFSKENVNDDKFTDVYNTIGSVWKKFNLNFVTMTGEYNILENNYYVVKTDKGSYYKLRFTNFVDNGIKGNISIQIQKL